MKYIFTIFIKTYGRVSELLNVSISEEYNNSEYRSG